VIDMRWLATAAAAAVVLAGCGSSDEPAPTRRSTGPATGTTAKRAAYHPKNDPSHFTRRIANPYLPYVPGRGWVFTGLKDSVAERVDVGRPREVCPLGGESREGGSAAQKTSMAPSTGRG
jgi:hypothetical protein